MRGDTGDGHESSAGDAPPSLLDEQRSLSRERILRAARAVGVSRGLDMRVEDVANEAGVSKRTIFRHFGSRDELLRQAFETGIRTYASRVPRPEPGEGAEEWLERACITVQKLNARIGRLWWDLATQHADEDDPDPPVYFDPEARDGIVRSFLDDAWSLYGGSGEPPQHLRAAFWVHMSAFTTRTLTTDLRCGIEEAGRLTARTLDILIRAAVVDTA